MKRPVKKRVFIKAAALAAALLVALLLRSAWSKTKQLLDYDVEVYSVLLGGTSGNNTEAQDALRLCPSILTTLRFGEPSEWTEELCAPMDRLMDQFYDCGYLPREPLSSVPGSGDYVTSMDAPLLAVTAELAYERGLGDRYHQYMEDLIPYIVSGTAEGGFVLKYSDEAWWPLEYAWKSVTEESAWFVSNGSFHGMVGIELLKAITKDPRLEELSEKALNAYREKADRFQYPDGSWCYYGLNYVDGKKIINTHEKLLIETRALKALYLLTEELFYQEELEWRAALLAGQLPVYIVEEEDGTNTVMLLRACAPHPYMVDIYPSTLEILNENGDILTTLEAGYRGVSNSCLMGKVPDGAASYRLYGNINPIEKTLLVEQSVTHIRREDLVTSPVSGTWTCGGDGVSIENGLLSIDADASEKLKAFTYFTPEEPVEYGPEAYWVVELDNPTEETFAMTAVLYDQNGTTMDRYLVSCQPGKNLQVINYLGFKDHEWPLDKVQTLSLAFVTNQMESPQAQVQIGNVYVFRKTADVVNYLSQYEFTDYWTIAA